MIINDPAKPASLHKNRLLLLIIALIVIRLAWVFVMPLTDTTEARYANIARLMVESGDWVTLWIHDQQPFWGKPPLSTWLSAAGMAVFGVSVAAARLPVLVLSLGLVAMLYRWARGLSGPQIALAACAILLSSALFFGAAAFVMTDMTLTFATTLAMISFYNMMEGAQAQRKAWGYLFFFALGLGLLGKGPLVLVLSALPLGIWVMATGRFVRALKTMPLVIGPVIMLAVALPWYIMAELKTPGFLRYFIIGEHYERFLLSNWQGDLYGSGHARPHGMIWPMAILAYAPWSALVPWLAWQRWRNGAVADTNGLRLYLLLWALSPMVFFTFASNILTAYVLPGMAAGAYLLALELLSGKGAVRKQRSGGLVHSMTVGFAGLAVAVTGVMIINPALILPKSQSYALDQIAVLDPEGQGQIIYWHKHYFSASFLSDGHVTYTDDADALRQMLNAENKTFVIETEGPSYKLPEDIAARLKPVSQFERVRLLVPIN